MRTRIDNGPDYLLFLQHGFADIAASMAGLARALSSPNTVVINPALNWLRTWWRLEPLIRTVESAAQRAFGLYPLIPARVVAHSMGGVIWLELLDRHPEWRSRVDSLVLIGSPVGGLSRWIDPLELKPGILRDLEVNHSALGQRVASQIPTLSIAGDLGIGMDGVVPVRYTKFPGARSIVIPGVAHAQLRRNHAVIESIKSFWVTAQPSSPRKPALVHLRGRESKNFCWTPAFAGVTRSSAKRES